MHLYQVAQILNRDNPTYEVFWVSKPVSDEDVMRYSRVRLLGLKTNPETFRSTYEGSKNNTLAQWRERIDAPERFTVAARLVGPEDADDEWLGTASILTPEMTGDAYALVGMWVNPAHRRRGLRTSFPVLIPS